MAAVGPVIRATSEDMALVIPIGSLVGTAGVLGLTFLQNWMHLRPATFGVMAGATLHEVAQVLAASSTVAGCAGRGHGDQAGARRDARAGGPAAEPAHEARPPAPQGPRRVATGFSRR